MGNNKKSQTPTLNISRNFGLYLVRFIVLNTRVPNRYSPIISSKHEPDRLVKNIKAPFNQSLYGSDEGVKEKCIESIETGKLRCLKTEHVN